MGLLIKDRNGIYDDTAIPQAYDPALGAYRDVESALVCDGEIWREVWPERPEIYTDVTIGLYGYPVGAEGCYARDNGDGTYTVRAYNSEPVAAVSKGITFEPPGHRRNKIHLTIFSCDSVNSRKDVPNYAGVQVTAADSLEDQTAPAPQVAVNALVAGSARNIWEMAEFQVGEDCTVDISTFREYRLFGISTCSAPDAKSHGYCEITIGNIYFE